MDSLQTRIRNYFVSRTKAQRGVIKDYISTSDPTHSLYLCDNDYLNLSNNEYVLREQVNDLEASIGRDVLKSPAFLTDDDPHTCLEKDMGEWFGKECYLAQSGYSANVGLMHAICTPGIHVYVDQVLHMSFYDGLAARRAKIHFNRPNDWVQLEENIQKHGPGIILVESVYSTTGAFAPLEEITRIKRQHGCVLVVDESHSFGVHGSKSYLHTKGLQDDVDYVTASLAKAYATRAGIIFASNALFIKENSLSYAFSSALMRNDVVRIRAIWDLIKTADDRRERLLRASRVLRSELSKVADLVEVDGPLPSQIVCIRAKDEDEMARLHRHLSSRGILAAPFFFPTTSLKHPILRLSVHCDVSNQDVYDLVNAIASFSNIEARL